MLERTPSTYGVWQTHAQRQPACSFLLRPPRQLLGDPQIYLLFLWPSSPHRPILSATSLFLGRLGGWISQPWTAIRWFRITCTLIMMWLEFPLSLRGAGESMVVKKIEFDSQSQEHQVYYCINILMSALEDSVLRIIDVFSEMCLFFTCHYNATYLFV